MICKICAGKSYHFSKAKIVDKYLIDYFQCSHCGFVQTETPYWLEEVYSKAINDSDLGLINRNITFSKISQALIHSFFDANGSFVDYGGGYGMFVRLMRNAGLDFYRFDKFCDNLFAQGFEATLADEPKYELLTAFELFEHFVDPLAEIEHLLRFSKNILFSTYLIPPNNPKPDEWWYYGLDHGQHVSLYTYKALMSIAEKFNMNLYTSKRSLHLLTKKRISPAAFYLFSRYKAAVVVNLFFKRKSLQAADYLKLTGKPMV